MPKLIDITGERFGRLTVLSHCGNRKIGRAGNEYATRVLWLCRCDCGNLAVVMGQNLRGGLTRSCGCLRTETSRENGRRRRGKKKSAGLPATAAL